MKRNDSIVTIIVVLDTFLAPSVYIDTLDSTTAYIALTSFLQQTINPKGSAEEFSVALDKTSWASNTVLDLRDNRGGYLPICVSIVSQFVEQGTVIIKNVERTVNFVTLTAFTMKDSLIAGIGQKALNRKFYVLVDHYTASASEILVSCLKERRSLNVKTIGTRTYGKGSGWNLIAPTPENAGLTITSMLLLPVFSESYNLIGILPDIVIDSTADALKTAMQYIHPSGLSKSNGTVSACRRVEAYRKILTTRIWFPMCIVDR